MIPLGLIATSPVSGSRALMLPPVHVTRPFLGSSRCNFQSCSLSCSSILFSFSLGGVWGGFASLEIFFSPPTTSTRGGRGRPSPPKNFLFPPTLSLGGVWGGEA